MTLTTSNNPFRTAHVRAVEPSLFLALMSMPSWTTKTSTTS
eukprot:CAMPEP_0197642660 /NCGR_PEP_ID=MMETSP1338-20131121/16258_1 /TAXON_ID=43686 ORGANISM="Pelagodinium beii, Strain RCC1491" /NCGR_SAMPLE_ID=MMETSP1338 /ASSEMBLY_ACC=CAM_ASM_000754 /LENGTH=40 /DNA_ID= /DNA_START= /DNA_END= /DNA_ORIENTATION=